MQTTRLWRPGAVLDRHDVLALSARIAELGDRVGRVGHEALAIVRIAPRPGDHARAVARADPRLVALDERVEGRRVDVTLLDEQGLERAHTRFDVRHLRAVVAVVVAAHDDAPAFLVGRRALLRDGSRSSATKTSTSAANSAAIGAPAPNNAASFSPMGEPRPVQASGPSLAR